MIKHLNCLAICGFCLLLLTGSAAADWHITTLDSSGDAGYFTSMALDGSGSPHIAYINEAIPAGLNYARFNGSDWDIQAIASGEFGHASIAVTADSLAHISYYDYSAQALLYRYDTADQGWVEQLLDDGTDPSSSGDVGRYSSMALDSAGRPHISYHNATQGHLKYFLKPWAIHVADDGTDTDTGSGVMGEHSAIAVAVNSAGIAEPHISYYDATSGNLKYFCKGCLGGGWHIQVLDDSPQDVGAYCDIALDGRNPSNILPHISYYDATNRDLKYFQKWEITVVDSAGDVGQYTSIALDSNHYPHISYYDATNGALKYAHYDGSAWSTQIVDNSGDAGRYSSIAVDSSGQVYISYQAADSGSLRLATTNASIITITTTTTSVQSTSTTLEPSTTTSVDNATSSSSSSSSSSSTTTTPAPATTTSPPPADTGGGGGSNSTTSVAPVTTTTDPISTTSTTTSLPQPPPIQITSAPETAAAAGVLYFYEIETDLDGESLTYDLTEFPQGMEIDKTLGVLTWEPSIRQVGEHPVAVRVQALSGQTATQEFILLVSALRQCPAGEAVGDSSPALSVLREFRDQRLAKTALGLTLTGLYYSHSREVTSLLASRPHLRSESAALLLEIVPLLQAATETGAGVDLPGRITGDLIDLMQALQPSATPELDRSIDFVVSILASGRLNDTEAGN